MIEIGQMSGVGAHVYAVRQQNIWLQCMRRNSTKLTVQFKSIQ